MDRYFEPIGEFTLTQPVLRVSDPCYEKDCWAGDVLKDCLTGIWEAAVDYDNSWGKRVSMLAIRHESGPQFSVFSNPRRDIQVEDTSLIAGVDSGQCGFFDETYYRDDKVCEGANDPSPDRGSYGEPWYTLCCHITLSEDQAGTIPYGAVSSSGYGDGSYEVFVTRDRSGYINGAAIMFIDDPEEDDEDDYYDDDEREDY